MKARLPSIQTIAGFDGQGIECGLWSSQTGRTKQAIILLGDRRCRDSLGLKTWASGLIHRLDMPDAMALTPDLGQARLEHAPHALEAVFNHLRDTYGLQARDIVLIGHGLGASRAAVFTHDHAPNLASLILDGLRFASLSLADRRVMHRVLRDAPAIIAPTLMLTSRNPLERDYAAQKRLADGLQSRVTTRDKRPNNQRDLAQSMSRFIRDCADIGDDQTQDLLKADQAGYTAQEYDRLRQPLPWYNPKAWYWQASRVGLRLASSLSQGIRLGQIKGFDSGAMLDYVYRNEARGLGPIGRQIDRQYINALGWRGIRQRKTHLEQLLVATNQRLSKAGMPTRLLDIAAGHGRYIIDAVQQFGTPATRVQLRDFDPHNVADGRALLQHRGLDDIARFDQGDAFDAADLAGLYQPGDKATLSVVSGLYELFPENEPVRQSLAGVAAATEQHGYLVYTGQPWHPQLEMIARALTSHRGGQAWAMRRRTQAEMDQLVREAGFEKLTQRTDPWGIFTVSLARKL